MHGLIISWLVCNEISFGILVHRADCISCHMFLELDQAYNWVSNAKYRAAADLKVIGY